MSSFLAALVVILGGGTTIWLAGLGAVGGLAELGAVGGLAELGAVGGLAELGAALTCLAGLPLPLLTFFLCISLQRAIASCL